MMKPKDYVQYETDLQRRLHLPKVYLTKWDYYEKNITSLTEDDLEMAKVLYKTLDHLTEDERLVLANKYRSNYVKRSETSPNYKLDESAANEYNLSLNQYRKLRRGIELKFFHYLQNYIDDSVIY